MAGNRATRVTLASETSAAEVHADQEQAGAPPACCSLFGNVGIMKVGIRNNCDQCKLAVISWDNHQILRYRVGGHSQIVIDCASLNGQLIGEDPCPP
jgi:hypothetical protein